ncbi:MAG: hypothetical protein AAB588_02295, partial [Patescibacteria group bacterium]
ANAEALITKFETCLSGLQSQVGTPDFWSNMQDCNTASRDIEDELNSNLRPQRDCFSTRRSIDDRRKEKKNNVNTQIKDILRNNKSADVSSLTAIATEMDAEFARVDKLSGCSTDAVDQLKEASSNLNGYFQDFYSTSNDVRQSSDEVRRAVEGQKDYEKNIKRQCEKDKTREWKNYDREYAKGQKNGTLAPDDEAAHAKVQELYNNQCVTLLGTMGEALKNGNLDAFEEARSEYWTSDRDFWDSLNDARGTVQEGQHKAEQVKNVLQQIKQQDKEIKRIKKDIQRSKKMVERAIKKTLNSTDRKEIAAALQALVKQAEELLAQRENIIATAMQEAPKDPDSFLMEWDEFNDFQNELRELSERGQQIAELTNRLQETEKELVRREKDLSRFPAELQVTLKELIATARESVKTAWVQLVNDPEAAMETMQNLQDLGTDWDTTVDDWKDSQE